MKIPNLRWLVAAALLMAAVLNYLDRSVLGLLIKPIQKDLGISDDQYANILNFFLVAYTLAYLFSGRVVDKLGVRLSLAIFVGWWSISNALTGLAQGFKSLAGFRFMLGLGEAGGFTASPKAVSEWFPASERAIAVGIYSVGGALGGVIAPLMVPMIAGADGSNWRWVFAISPILAGTWLVFWLWLYRPPEKHPMITDKELAYLRDHLQQADDAADKPKESEWSLWKGVFRERTVWRLMIARMLTDPVWYFYQFWMPKYLQEVRGLNQKEVSIMWMIFVAADLGFILGGLFSGLLVKRGQNPPAARLWLMLASAFLVPLSFFVPAMQSVGAVIAIGMCVAYAHTQWLGNMTSLVVDIMPKRILATSFGVIAAGSALGGIFMNKLVAWFISPTPFVMWQSIRDFSMNYWNQGGMDGLVLWINNHRSYTHLFYIMAIVHPLALALIWSLRKKPSAA
jgi:ACS family hexuronate transporter-like MFS transporter